MKLILKEIVLKMVLTVLLLMAPMTLDLLFMIVESSKVRIIQVLHQLVVNSKSKKWWIWLKKLSTRILNGKMPTTFWEIIKRNYVKGHHGYADKAMLVLNITIQKIKEEIQKSSNTGRLQHKQILIGILVDCINK